MMPGVTLTYGARKSMREVRIRKVVGLEQSKKGVKKRTFCYRAQKIKNMGFGRHSGILLRDSMPRILSDSHL